MKSMKTLMIGLAGTLNAILPAANASEGVGTHGGNAVVCFANRPEIADILTLPGKTVSVTIPDEYIPEITSVETLDLYEARTGIHGEKMKVSVPIKDEETEEEYVERIRHRFSGWVWKTETSKAWRYELSSEMGQIIAKGKAIFKEIDPITDERFLPSDDIEPIQKAEPGCVYTTIAKQSYIGFSKNKKLVIDDRVFSHATHQKNKLSRAVLMLHEYVLAQLGSRENKTEAVRAVVAYMIARDVSLNDLRFVLGMSALQNVVPHSVHSLVWDEAFQLRGKLVKIRYNAQEQRYLKFETEHFGELPRKFRKVYGAYKSDGTPYVRDGFGGRTFLCQNLGMSMNKKNCEKLEQFRLAREDAAKKAILLAEAEFRKTHQSEWARAMEPVFFGVKTLRFPEDRQQQTIDAVRSWDVFNLNHGFKGYIDVDANEVMFPY